MYFKAPAGLYNTGVGVSGNLLRIDLLRIAGADYGR
jgi:hypothetical protein